MKEDVERQIKGIVRRQKKLARSSTDLAQRAQVYGVWAGFLAGMKMTGVISNVEYQQLYDEVITSLNSKNY